MKMRQCRVDGFQQVSCFCCSHVVRNGEAHKQIVSTLIEEGNWGVEWKREAPPGMYGQICVGECLCFMCVRVCDVWCFNGEAHK